MKLLLLLVSLFSVTAGAVSYEQSFQSLGDGPDQYATFASFPVSATDGELGMDQSSGTLYVWSSGSWQVVGAPGLITAIGALNGQAKNANAGTVSGNTIYMQSADATWPGVLTAADWSTFNSKFTLPALTAGSVLFSDGSTIAQDNTNFFWDDTSNILRMRADKYRFGYTDPFARNALWAYDTNQVLLLGSWGADGLPANSNSEGIIVYGDEAITSTPIGAANGSYARIKAGRFGLFSVESTLPAYAGGQYYFHVNPTSLYLRDNSGAKTFEVTRATGAIDTALGAGVVQSDASGVLNSAALNASQVVNTPAGNIAATDVQAALNELDTEKQATGTTWLLGGNAGTNPGVDYVGTSDAQDFNLRSNGVARLSLKSGGTVEGSQARDVADNTTENLNLFGAYFNPAAARTNAFSRGLYGFGIYDQPNSGFSNTGGVSGVSGRFEHSGSGTLGFGSVFDGSAYFGANSGTTTLYKGLNLDTSISDGATVTDFYGISNTANIATATFNNYQLANFSIVSSDGSFSGITGLNINPYVYGTSSVANNVFGLTSIPNIDGTATVGGSVVGIQSNPVVQDSAVVTSTVYGADISPQVKDTSTVNDFVGVNVNASVTGTATVTNGMVGARVTVGATPVQSSVKGIEVNLNSVEVAPGSMKYGIDIQDGAVQAGYDYTIPSAMSYYQQHYIGGSTSVAAADPISTFGFGINLAQTVNFQDDWTADPSNLGFNAVGFVGVIQGAAGKTMYSWTGALGGAGNPAGAGTLTNANMFKAAGILPQGGSLAVTNMYGFIVDPALFCLVGTNCWGFYEDTAAAENHMSKLAIGTSTKKVVNSSTALEIGNSKGFVNGSGTTATKNALTAVAGMQFYDTTLNKLQWYNGLAWVDAASAAAPTDIQEAPAGSINNSNTAFTLSQTPTSNAAVQLYKNGRLLIQGTDYTIAGVNITMTVAPDFAELLRAVYRY